MQTTLAKLVLSSLVVAALGCASSAPRVEHAGSAQTLRNCALECRRPHSGLLTAMSWRDYYSLVESDASKRNADVTWVNPPDASEPRPMIASSF